MKHNISVRMMASAVSKTLMTCFFGKVGWVLALILTVALPDAVAERYIGMVLDEAGKPVPFASVYVKDNPYIGTATDYDGLYAIEITEKADLLDDLVFSFIGYRTVEVPIAEMYPDSLYNVMLIEQPIMLDAAEVTAKISRKESKKIKKNALDKFIQQLEHDFPSRTTAYSVVSSYQGAQDSVQLISHEIIGTITEYPLQRKKGGDSVAVEAKSVKEYTAEQLETGYEKFNEMAAEQHNKNAEKHNKRKKNKNTPMPTYTKRDLDDQTMKMHRFLWGGYTGNFLEMLNSKKISMWDYTLIGDQNVLTYTDRKNYLGIVKTNLQIHFYIDPVTYSIEKIAQSLEAEVHIPFGYKLSREQLDLINTIQVGIDTLDSYRARHAYADVKRNVFFREVDGNRVVREKNLDVQTTVIGTKKQKLNYSAKAKVVITGKPVVTKKENE